jgi:hypothetical protein
MLFSRLRFRLELFHRVQAHHPTELRASQRVVVKTLQEVPAGGSQGGLRVGNVERRGRAVFVVVLHHGQDALSLADIEPGRLHRLLGPLEFVQRRLRLQTHRVFLLGTREFRHLARRNRLLKEAGSPAAVKQWQAHA